MNPLSRLRDALEDGSLRLAILVGLATVPVTVALSSGLVSEDPLVVSSTFSGTPLFLAGLYVGYRYSGRGTETHRAGSWCGLAGSLAIPLVVAASVVSAATTAGTLSSSTLLAAAFTVLTVGFGVGVTVLLTLAGALLADWVTTRHRARRGSDERHLERTPTRWTVSIAVYALVTLPVVGAVLWLAPDGSAGFAVAVLGLLGLYALTAVTFVGLFIDATEPRATDAWTPTVPIYVGFPVAVSALVYVGAATRNSVNPAGDAVYGFFVALWFVSVVYLLRKYSHGEPIVSAHSSA
ncbi:DUF5518 domain-containing protein [Natronobiforma cellulositropha]|uniref:DUF5518 domain-containing protein n=1 Tax=Natronobiforma cellulositropha TaxID=1679076 RepID=UPI0021D5CACD|nr:DUF5518 domain-containing protein [Natronobiforma cellulositropha]